MDQYGVYLSDIIYLSCSLLKLRKGLYLHYRTSIHTSFDWPSLGWSSHAVFIKFQVLPYSTFFSYYTWVGVLMVVSWFAKNHELAEFLKWFSPLASFMFDYHCYYRNFINDLSHGINTIC